MTDAEIVAAARQILTSWKKRDDNDNGFSRNIHRDNEQTIDALYQLFFG